jgi:hypothetical protein
MPLKMAYNFKNMNYLLLEFSFFRQPWIAGNGNVGRGSPA